MKKLLILAYDFPPYVSVGGLRPYSWFKYLHQFDTYPIVVTRQWENSYRNHLDYISPGYSDSTDIQETSEGTLIKTSFEPTVANKMILKYGENKLKILRKMITFYYEFSQFFLPVGSKIEIFRAADEYLKYNKVDCIIATGDPFILFKYASKLSEKYSIPWIADYRDAWIQDKTLKDNAYSKWFAFNEKKLLANVHRITTVSTFIAKQIEQNVKGKKFEIVYNGFDPDVIKVTENICQQSDYLSIGFAGTVSDWHPIESFLRTCNEVLTKNKDFKLKLNFYGINKEKEIKQLLMKKYNLLEDQTTFYARMSNLEFAKVYAVNNVFLLFNDYSILGTKIFDCLAINRKVILCYKNDKEAEQLKEKYFALDEFETESKSLQADMINTTNSGIIVENSEHLKQVLLELGKELEKNGFIKCESTNFNNYSRINQVKHLAEIINGITKDLELCRQN